MRQAPSFRVARLAVALVAVALARPLASALPPTDAAEGPGRAEIRITRPQSQQTLLEGSRLDIAWNLSGRMARRVTIDLMRNGGVCRAIARGVPNTGRFDWTVTGPERGGAEAVRIRIRTGDGRVTAFSGPFRILPAQ